MHAFVSLGLHIRAAAALHIRAAAGPCVRIATGLRTRAGAGGSTGEATMEKMRKTELVRRAVAWLVAERRAQGGWLPLGEVPDAGAPFEVHWRAFRALVNTREAAPADPAADGLMSGQNGLFRPMIPGLTSPAVDFGRRTVERRRLQDNRLHRPVLCRMV